MFERMYLWLIERPGRLTSMGRAVITAGSLLLVLGAIGRVLVTAASFAPGSRMSGLAGLGLPFPTLVVPESMFGVLTCLVLIGFGSYAMYVGRSMERLLRSLR
ncbi:MAG TPA: hypothetical protein VHA82_01845 [Ramlibacter sp.]|uniref:hypothetical protein n=1 Tax=Ramlibacter sp. TaxID=1917967 RepID=UPI002C4E2398|nr:hypothetical protein [Ramlibacter sp.]HVZ42522.1 hypothetical protein [Ramlibacter sp.]